MFRTKVSARGVGVNWLWTASTGAWDGDRPKSQTRPTAATSSSVTAGGGDACQGKVAPPPVTPVELILACHDNPPIDFPFNRRCDGAYPLPAAMTMTPKSGWNDPVLG